MITIEYPNEEKVDDEIDILPIPGYPGYYAGSDGSIWSDWARGRKGVRTNRLRKLKIKPLRSGYCRVGLYLANERKYECVHRLILLAFIGPCPSDKECCHKNSNPSDNRLENLVWGTKEENAADKKKNGTYLCGEKMSLAKLTWKQVAEIRAKHASGKYTCQQLANEYGVSRQLISCVVHNKIWKLENSRLFHKGLL